MATNTITSSSDGHPADGKNDIDDKIMLTSRGCDAGNWTGTNKTQNEDNNDARLSSSIIMRRQSIKQIQEQHGPALQAMIDEFGPTVPIHELVRFLKARNYNFEKAKKMYHTHLEWKSTYLPTIDKSRAIKTLETRKFYMLENLDTEGRPVMYYCFRRFQELGYDIDREIEALVYLVENFITPKFVGNNNSLEQQKFTVLIDVSNITSPPMKFLHQVNAIMEANYPETLHRSIMFPVPYWLQKVIKTFLVFVAQETRDKFAYVNDTKSLEEFALFPMSQMPPDITELINNKKLKNNTR